MRVLQVIAVKAPGFGERKSSYLEDIAIMTGAQVVKEELGLSLDKVRCISSLFLKFFGHREVSQNQPSLQVGAISNVLLSCDLLYCHHVAAFAILLVRFPHAKQGLYQHVMYQSPQGPILATGMQNFRDPAVVFISLSDDSDGFIFLGTSSDPERRSVISVSGLAMRRQ